MPRSALAALVVALALPPAAAAQAPDTTHPQFTVSASLGAASLANISTGRPTQRPGAHLSLMVGAAISPRLTIRLDATAASVRTLSVLQMAGGFDDTTRVDSLPPAAAMLGASLSIEATPWASMPLRLRAGPAYLYAESPEAAPPRPVPPLDPYVRAHGLGWRLGASLPLGGATSPVWLSVDAMRATSRRGATWLVPVGLEVRFR